MKIKLTKGFETTIDDKDYEWLSKYKWHENGHGYACTTGYMTADKKKHHNLMHRMILGLTERGVGEVDHINMDRLDNRRSNIRIVTRSENSLNKKVRADSQTGEKYIHKEEKGFTVSVKNRFKNVYVGYKTTLAEAIELRDAYFSSTQRKERKPLQK